MNVVLLPMWLLSGAFFPLAGAPWWLRLLMRINPLTYGVSALHDLLVVPAGGLGAAAAATAASASSAGVSPAAAVAITLALALVAYACDLVVTRGGRVE
jgi:ABC-2 type transport system permease protein